MNKINIDIFLNIWSYVGPNTIYIAPPLERLQIKKMKNKFKENPLCLYYRLVKWKSVVSHNRTRPTMRVDKKEKFILLGGNKPMNINKHNKIELFNSIKKEIIPHIKIVSSSVPGRIYQVLWNIYYCRIENIERAKLYSLFWNNY